MKYLFALALLVSLSAHADTALNPQTGYVPLGGRSCGGVHWSTFVTGFDVNGNVTGVVKYWTRCSTGGRGSIPKTYRESDDVVWSIVDGVAMTTTAGSVAVTDLAFTATDAYGDVIHNTEYTTPSGKEVMGMLRKP